MIFTQRPVVFECADETLLGIAAIPDCPADVGVLVIVGGAQYRIGSHRQFLLLSRQLAGEGIACMRFDFRGMGDGSGALRDFEGGGEDIRAALDVFSKTYPSLQRVVLWGLCDAASAAALYAHTDARVRGLILLNPWVRTEAGAARTYLRHYYVRRLTQGEFWRKLLGGRLRLGYAGRNFMALICGAFKKPMGKPGQDHLENAPSLPERVGEGLRRFSGPVQIFLAGQDYTAQEFDAAIHQNTALRQGLAACQVTWARVPEANHTFSTARWRAQVETETIRWIKRLEENR